MRRALAAIAFLLLVAVWPQASTVIIHRRTPAIVCEGGTNLAEITDEFNTDSLASWDGDEFTASAAYSIDNADNNLLRRIITGGSFLPMGYDPTETTTVDQWVCAKWVARASSLSFAMLHTRKHADDSHHHYGMGVWLRDGGAPVGTVYLIDFLGDDDGDEYTGCGNAGVTAAPFVMCYSTTGTTGTTVHKLWLNPPCCSTATECGENQDQWSLTTPFCTVTSAAASLTVTTDHNTNKHVGISVLSDTANADDIDWWVAGSD